MIHRANRLYCAALVSVEVPRLKVPIYVHLKTMMTRHTEILILILSTSHVILFCVHLDLATLYLVCDCNRIIL